MDVGRFFLGLGGEAFKVANYAVLPLWFTRTELAFVNAVASLSRFGNVIVNIISPRLATSYSINVALLPGNVLCILSILCVFSFQALEKYFQSKNQNQVAMFEMVPMNDDSNHEEVQRNSGEIEDATEESKNPLNATSTISTATKFTILTSEEDEDEDNDQLMERRTPASDVEEANDNEEERGESRRYNNFNKKLKHSYDENDDSGGQASVPSATGVAAVSSKFSVSSIFSVLSEFDSTYWLLLASCCLIYACMGPFNNIASSVLLERDYFKAIPSIPHLCQSSYNRPHYCPTSNDYQLPLPQNYSSYFPLTPEDIDCSLPEWKNGCTAEYCQRLTKALEKTSFIMSIPFFLYACFTVPLGRLSDRIGRRLELLLISSIVFFIAHLTLALGNTNAIFSMIGQGIGNCLFITVYWPILPLITDEKIFGKAYGLALSLQNTTYVVMPMILAKIFQESNQQYIPKVELVFVLTSFAGGLPILFLLYQKYCSSGSAVNSFRV
jgi:MFS family permease